MKSRAIVIVLLALAGAGGALAVTGHLPGQRKAEPVATTDTKAKSAAAVAALAVSVTRVTAADFVETVLVTGSLVPREEILVGPEVEGLRITEVLADEGDRVKKGQVLARLVFDTLEAQLAQNQAAQARATAAIAQAKSNIASMEAKQVEARNSYNRGMPLKQSGYLSESLMDQRESALRSADAALVSARDGLKLAEAEKAQVEAQGREIAWKRGRTDIVAPAEGIVSRRVARIGGFAAGASDSMFRIVAKGEIELDAEVVETSLGKVKDGQIVMVEAAGAPPVKGTVRLVSPEIDKATRLGRVRVFIGDLPGLRVGAFARGSIETARSRGLSVPASAILYAPEGPSVQVVDKNRVATRRVRLGLEQGQIVEVKEGLADGDLIVTKSGTFLRDGDAVEPVLQNAQRVSTTAG